MNLSSSASAGAPKPIIFIGAGGHFRSVLDVALSRGDSIVAGVLDDTLDVGTKVLGVPVLGRTSEVSAYRNSHSFHIAVGKIGKSMNRKDLGTSCWDAGASLATLIASTAYVSPFAQVGEGTVVHHGAIINAGAVIGRNTIVNSQSLVEHDAVVGDHCHISTGALINGGVRLGHNSFVGSGAIVFQGLIFVEETVIPAGTVVSSQDQL